MDRPEDVTKQLVAHLDAGDLDAIVHLYERDAVFVDLDGIARGPEAIRAAHQRFLDSNLTLVLDDCAVFEADDLALVQWSWTVRGDGFDGSGASAEVLRRQADGTWRFIIDNSDGAVMIGRT